MAGNKWAMEVKKTCWVEEGMWGGVPQVEQGITGKLAICKTFHVEFAN
jgi:hypothetical protein